MENEKTINIGLIGSGSISRFIHIPGFQLCKDVRVIIACDANLETAKSTAKLFNIPEVTMDYKEVTNNPDITAVVIATPNDLHGPISLAAIENGKHVLCEKPLGLDLMESKKMLNFALQSDLVHMVSFVYRYAPAIQYLKYLIERNAFGEIRHFRAQYLQKVPDIYLGWRSKSEHAGHAGALGDIGSHLIDFARFLVGEITSVSGWTKTFLPKRKIADSDIFENCDVDDAAGFIAEFSTGATGVFEVSRLVPGRGCGKNEFQLVEINGTKGSALYTLQDPFNLKVFPGSPFNDGQLYNMPVPEEFLKISGAPRRIINDEPVVGFRYDQAFTFIQSIRREIRTQIPDFRDGERAQAVVDAVLQASESRKWVQVED